MSVCIYFYFLRFPLVTQCFMSQHFKLWLIPSGNRNKVINKCCICNVCLGLKAHSFEQMETASVVQICAADQWLLAVPYRVYWTLHLNAVLPCCSFSLCLHMHTGKDCVKSPRGTASCSEQDYKQVLFFCDRELVVRCKSLPLSHVNYTTHDEGETPKWSHK